jgi:flagellar biogenesis protein FliO
MSGQRTRIVALCLMLVIGGGWISLSARSAGREAPLVTRQAQAGEFAAMQLADPNETGLTDTPLGSGELFARMMLSVAIVAVLGLGALYLSKRVLPKVANASGKEVCIRETVYLGPRKALHLVEVGRHKLLIGSTNESITALAHLTDGWIDLPKQQAEDTVRL